MPRGGILSSRLAAERIDLKAKLSQNHPLENRLAVLARLADSTRPSNRDVADWMRATLPVMPEGA